MTSYLEQLTKLVPPPDVVERVGTMADWEAIARKIEQQIPLDPVEISLRYGSGQFVDGEFSLVIFNVFHSFYPRLVQIRRSFNEAERRAGIQQYDNPFQIGVIQYGPEQGDMANVFWAMKGPVEKWPVYLNSAPHQCFHMALTEFLVKAFRGELDVDKFPKPFVDLRFVPHEDTPATQSSA
jgi:hypothetical protein